MSARTPSPAKNEPEFRHLNGEDPTAFVLSANIHRRHLTKGQRAMAVARIYPEPEKLKRAGSPVPGHPEINKRRISEARTVLAYASNLSDGVLSGAVSLDEAYKEARQRKTDSESTETRLEKLRDINPQLADKKEASAMPTPSSKMPRLITLSCQALMR